MIFKKIIQYSPRKRALPRIAEGFSPTARGENRFIFLIFIMPSTAPQGRDAHAPWQPARTVHRHRRSVHRVLPDEPAHLTRTWLNHAARRY